MSIMRGKGSGPASAIAGIVGVVCLVWAAAGGLGLIGSVSPEPEYVPVRTALEAGETEADPAAVAEIASPPPPIAPAAAVGAPPVASPVPAAIAGAAAASEGRPSHYPLEVGRYWVYRYEDPGSGAVAEVERSVVGRELRDERDLYHFADGTVVYVEEDKVYELGADGGVNVIPLDPGNAAPYVYRSQGMQIAKRIGAVDTVLVAGGHQYEDCMEVITEFRALEDGAKPAISYSSFYARGVGLVGRERWPRGSGANLSVELNEHGMRQL